MSARDTRVRLTAGLGGRILAALMRTVRFSTEGETGYSTEWDAGRPVIFLLWHGRLLPLSWFHRTWKLVTLISPSRDGEYIAHVVGRWGYTVVRGSSSRRGGAALRELVRFVRAGRSIAVTPDGPRGPREKLKPGVLLVAQLTGCALVPVAAAADRAWWFEGWDRFLVPRPFARVRIAYGRPVRVRRDATEAELTEATSVLEDTLGELTARVEARSS